MSYEGIKDKWTLPASGDLSGKQYYLMGVNSSGQAATASVAGQLVIGPLLNKPAAAGRAAEIQVGGVAKVITSEAIAAGAKVASDESGKAVTAYNDAEVIGIALVAATAGDIIPILIGRSGKLEDFMTLVSSGDLTGSQYLAVKVDSNGKAAVAGDGEQVLGSLYNAPDTDEIAVIKVAGKTTFTANAVTTTGGNIGCGASGKVNDAATGDAIIGIGLEAATGDADTFSVFITNAGESA